MKLQEQCTTIEQSKKLLELGFYKDTASLKWYQMTSDKWEINNYSYVVSLEDVSCWTIGDMLNIILSNKGFSIEDLNGGSFTLRIEHSYSDIETTLFPNDSLRDNLFDCLCWLKKYNRL